MTYIGGARRCGDGRERRPPRSCLKARYAEGSLSPEGFNRACGQLQEGRRRLSRRRAPPLRSRLRPRCEDVDCDSCDNGICYGWEVTQGEGKQTFTCGP